MKDFTQTYTCNKCDVTDNVLDMEIRYVYIIDKEEFKLIPQLAWCHTCNHSRTIENIEDTINIHEQEAIGLFSSIINKPRCYQLIKSALFKKTILRAKRLNTLMEALRAKNPSELRCLTCGSTNIDTIKINDNGTYMHPTCKGIFLSKSSEEIPYYKRKAHHTHLYNIEGCLIDTHVQYISLTPLIDNATIKERESPL